MVAVLVESVLSLSASDSFLIPPDNGEFRHDASLPRRPNHDPTSIEHQFAKQWKCHQAISAFLDVPNKQRRGMSLSYLQDGCDVPTRHRCQPFPRLWQNERFISFRTLF